MLLFPSCLPPFLLLWFRRFVFAVVRPRAQVAVAPEIGRHLVDWSGWFLTQEGILGEFRGFHPIDDDRTMRLGDDKGAVALMWLVTAQHQLWREGLLDAAESVLVETFLRLGLDATHL